MTLQKLRATPPLAIYLTKRAEFTTQEVRGRKSEVGGQWVGGSVSK